jgi:DNA-binding response OmpR family regulator
MLPPYLARSNLTLSVLVFLVEDEALIQELVEHALQKAGFDVVGANSGKEAIAMLEADGVEFRALVSDVNLGGGPTGWDVARRARELNEHLPVVYMTRGNGHEWASQGVPNSILIGKPFAPAQIVTAVSQLLNTSEH